MAISFYQEGNTPRRKDTIQRIEMKILGAVIDGGTGGGSGGLTGAGAPSAGLGSDGGTYWDSTNKDLYVKDSGTWVMVVDLLP